MLGKFFSVSLLLVLGGSLEAAEALKISNPDAYQQPRVREAVDLVNHAADAIANQGDVVFKDFNDLAQWSRDGENTYLFVFDMQGNQVVNAAFPEVAGINRLNWKDAWGKPMFRLAIDKLDPKKEGRSQWWVHYLWPKPGDRLPSWKSTYMVRTSTPEGAVYVVAAGVYDVRPEKLFIEQMVQDATDLIRQHGTAAFEQIGRRESEFFFDDIFVFVLDEKGVERANAAFPYLVGRNLLELPDFAGKTIIEKELDFVREHGAGWLSVQWPRANSASPNQEDVYLSTVRIGNSTFIVGSGIYKD